MGKRRRDERARRNVTHHLLLFSLIFSWCRQPLVFGFSGGDNEPSKRGGFLFFLCSKHTTFPFF
jgi:hypothetical protein